MNCLLCHGPSNILFNNVFLCSHCELVFKDPALHFNREEDLKRYSTHQNNEADQGYIEFLKKLAAPLENFVPEYFTALDFGCGPGPTLSILLKKMGGDVSNFDPLFFPDTDLFKKSYDVVTCSEVVEHFKNPREDWEKLVGLLKVHGVLGIMTLFFDKGIDYPSWWYKNDPTHVVFYQEKTMLFLAKTYGLEILFNDRKSVIIFKKKEEQL